MRLISRTVPARVRAGRPSGRPYSGGRKIFLPALTAVLLSAVFFSGCGQAPAVQWRNDYTACERDAKDAKKPLLLLFTGSDWCWKCRELETRVLATAEFNREMRGRAVFFLADYPRRRALTEELKEQNEALKKRWKVEHFPTLLKVAPDGQVISRHEGFWESYREFAAWFSTR